MFFEVEVLEAPVCVYINGDEILQAEICQRGAGGAEGEGWKTAS